jgi:hypothetical protein
MGLKLRSRSEAYAMPCSGGDAGGDREVQNHGEPHYMPRVGTE